MGGPVEPYGSGASTIHVLCLKWVISKCTDSCVVMQESLKVKNRRRGSFIMMFNLVYLSGLVWRFTA